MDKGNEQAKQPYFYDVRAGVYDQAHRVYRFAGTELGKARAKKYTEEFNASLMKAMDLTERDVKRAQFTKYMSAEAHDLASRVEAYRDHAASFGPTPAVPVIGDDDPVPTDYPHDY